MCLPTYGSCPPPPSYGPRRVTSLARLLSLTREVHPHTPYRYGGGRGAETKHRSGGAEYAVVVERCGWEETTYAELERCGSCMCVCAVCMWWQFSEGTAGSRREGGGGGEVAIREVFRALCKLLRTCMQLHTSLRDRHGKRRVQLGARVRGVHRWGVWRSGVGRRGGEVEEVKVGVEDEADARRGHASSLSAPLYAASRESTVSDVCSLVRVCAACTGGGVA